MAWRIADYIERGEIDNREKGRVFGQIWINGIDEPIVLERGVTYDAAFHDWANEVYSPEGLGGVSLKNFRKDILVTLMNLQGVPVRSYKVYRCWPSAYTALPELSANDNAVAIQSLTLQDPLSRQLAIAGQPEPVRDDARRHEKAEDDKDQEGSADHGQQSQVPTREEEIPDTAADPSRMELDLEDRLPIGFSVSHTGSEKTLARLVSTD